MTHENEMTALQALEEHQRQLDFDGCEVGVSRQALDVVLADYKCLKSEKKALGSLLAILHRDGGHYEAEHGTLKAIQAAERNLHHTWVVSEDTAQLNLIKILENINKLATNHRRQYSGPQGACSNTMERNLALYRMATEYKKLAMEGLSS